jgi:hypothetical protein
VERGSHFGSGSEARIDQRWPAHTGDGADDSVAMDVAGERESEGEVLWSGSTKPFQSV